MATSSRNWFPLSTSLEAIAGILLLLSPLFITFPPTAYAIFNNVTVGASVALIAGLRGFHSVESAGWSWATAVLGIWILGTPWALGFAANSAPMWTNVILGAAIAVFGTWSALADQASTQRPAT